MTPEQFIDLGWARLEPNVERATPDAERFSMFTVDEVTQNFVSVTVGDARTQITIPRAAFIDAVRVLQDNNAYRETPIRINSSNDRRLASVLCRTTRDHCGGTRVINYMAPLLERMGIVAVGRNTPNTIWLLQ